MKSLEAKPLPSAAVCQDLIRLYFHYVHPWLPIINAAEFLQTYNENVDKLSKLLLWSVLYAAASVSNCRTDEPEADLNEFVGTASLQESGFADRKAMKEHFYLHAKVARTAVG